MSLGFHAGGRMTVHPKFLVTIIVYLAGKTLDLSSREYLAVSIFLGRQWCI